jgi:hypothetical protein
MENVSESLKKNCHLMEHFFKKLINPTKIEKLISIGGTEGEEVEGEPRILFVKMETIPGFIKKINPTFTQIQLDVKTLVLSTNETQYNSSHIFSTYYPIFYKDFINTLKNNSIHTLGNIHTLGDGENTPTCDYIKMLIAHISEEAEYENWGNERDRLIREDVERTRMRNEGLHYDTPPDPNRLSKSILRIRLNIILDPKGYYRRIEPGISISLDINGVTVKEVRNIQNEEYNTRLKTKKIMSEFKEKIGIIPSENPKSVFGKEYRKTLKQFRKKINTNRGGKKKTKKCRKR